MIRIRYCEKASKICGGAVFSNFVASSQYLILTNSNVRHGLWFFEKQRFLSRLPCGVYLSTVRNSTFVDRISVTPLKAMAKNHHFWRCLPIEYIRDMMKKTRIGRKLSIFTAIEACHAIRRVHNPDLEVCIYFDLNFCAIIIFWRWSGYLF